MPRVFISYRRDDSAGYAGRLFDRLSAQLGRDHVFMDVDAIGAGEDFVQKIRNEVEASDVLILIIGTRWLASKNAEGEPRLEDPEDFVRLELLTAFERGIRIIPVLVDGATMPATRELSAELADLAHRNAITLSHAGFESDVGQLLEALGIESAEAPAVTTPPSAWRRWLLPASIALAAIAIATLVWWIRRPPGVDREVPILAVASFDNQTSEKSLAGYEKVIPNLVSDNISQSPRLELWRPSRADKLLEADSGASSPQKAARSAGVAFLLTGEINQDPRGASVAVELREVGRDRALASNRFDGLTEDSFADVAEQISSLVRRKLDLPGTERVQYFGADVPAKNLAAYQAYVLGLERFLEGRYPDAEGYFESALEHAPGFIMARYRLAHTQASSGKRDAALASIEQAITDASSQSEPDRLLSDKDRRLLEAARAWWSRSYEEASALYRQITEAFPADMEAHQFLGTVLFESGLYREAEAPLLVANDLDRTAGDVWNVLGNVYLKLGRVDDAVEAFEEFMKLEPDSAIAHHSLGEAYQYRGDLDSAAREFERALELNSNLRWASLSLATISVLRGHHTEAIGILRAITDGRDVELRFRVAAVFDLAGLLSAVGRFREAAETLRSLEAEIEIDGRTAQALVARGRLLLEIGEHTEAESLITEAVELTADARYRERYLFARGLLDLSVGRLGEVESTIAQIRGQAAAGGKPNRRAEKAASYLQGMLWLANGEPEGAVAELRSTLDLPHAGYALHQLGLARALRAADRPDEALEVAIEAERSRDPADPRLDLEVDRLRALLLQAEVHQELGRSDEAASLADRFLTVWRQADPGLPETRRARRLSPDSPRREAGPAAG